MISRFFSYLHQGWLTLAKIISQLRLENQQLRRYFHRKHDLRMEKVENFLDRRIPTGDSLSTNEIVAVLSLIAANEPFPNAIQALTRISASGTRNHFGDDFFRALKDCSRNLMHMGLDQEAADLIKIGEMAAQMHNQTHWASDFKEMVDHGLSSRIRDYPFMPQRGW